MSKVPLPIACSKCARSMSFEVPRCPTCGGLRLDIVRDKNRFYGYLFVGIAIFAYTLYRINMHLPMFSSTPRVPQNEGGAYRYSLIPEVFFKLHRFFLWIGGFFLLIAIIQYIRVTQKMHTMKWF